MADDRQLVSLRVDRELHARIKAAAEDENRSVNNYLTTVLDKVVPSTDPSEAWAQDALYRDLGLGKYATDRAVS